ncbi:MAG: hypothetical protein KH828_08020 [Clostridiales bacterium]|nr:hypothetical protein [Clostridiales bacterium]
MHKYFSGWYFKCQTDSHTIALIPAFHMNGEHASASLQIITSDLVQNLTFPFSSVRLGKGGNYFVVGRNRFTKNGIRLDIRQKGFTAYGFLNFGPFAPISYDIMGPFSLVPFMECRHRILSMNHTVNGALNINGKTYTFCDGSGYIEGDRGYSFPKAYAWTHCFFPEGSLSLSVAQIPLGCIRFNGIICVIHWRGKEYRLATYLGARLLRWEDGTIAIRQGNYQLTARLLSSDTLASDGPARHTASSDDSARHTPSSDGPASHAPSSHPLHAPVNGAMTRIIREHPVCRAFYCFRKGSRVLFSFVSEKASFEYEG